MNPGEKKSLGRKIFFKIPNTTGKDQCAICHSPAPNMVKHLATGQNLCQGCIRDLVAEAAKTEEPEYRAPEPLPEGLFKELFPYLFTDPR